MVGVAGHISESVISTLVFNFALKKQNIVAAVLNHLAMFAFLEWIGELSGVCLSFPVNRNLNEKGLQLG